MSAIGPEGALHDGKNQTVGPLRLDLGPFNLAPLPSLIETRPRAESQEKEDPAPLQAYTRRALPFVSLLSRNRPALVLAENTNDVLRPCRGSNSQREERNKPAPLLACPASCLTCSAPRYLSVVREGRGEGVRERKKEKSEDGEEKIKRGSSPSRWRVETRQGGVSEVTDRRPKTSNVRPARYLRKSQGGRPF